MRALQIGIIAGVLGLLGCAAEDPRASAATACELETVDDLHPADTMDEQLCELLRTAAPEAVVTLERADGGALTKLTYVNPDEGLRVIVTTDASGRPAAIKRMRNLLVTEEQRLEYDGAGHLVAIDRLELGELVSTVELSYEGDRVVARTERDQAGAMLASMSLQYLREGAEVVAESRDKAGAVIGAVTYERQDGANGLLAKVIRRDAAGTVLEEVLHQYDGSRLVGIERRDGSGSVLGGARYAYVGEGALREASWTDAAGNVTSAVRYGYDDEGKVSAREVVRAGAREAIMNYTYDGDGILSQIAILQ